MIVKLHTIPWGLHCGFHPAHIKKATLPCYQKSCTWDSTPSGELWSRYSKQGLEKTWELFIMLPKHSPQPPPQNQGILLKKPPNNQRKLHKTAPKTNHKNTNVKNRKATQEVNTMYLNLIYDLGGKWSTVLTAWRTVPSQLKGILAWQGKSWDFQHSVEGCLHFPFDECYREQRTNPVCFSFCLHWSRESFPNTLSLSFQGPQGTFSIPSLWPPTIFNVQRQIWRGCTNPQLWKTVTHHCQVELATHLTSHKNISMGLTNTVAKPEGNAKVESWFSVIMLVQPLCP